MFEILALGYREQFVEVALHGSCVGVRGHQVEFAVPTQFGAFPARSLLKPFQLAVALSAFEKVDAPERWAAASGSTSASLEQVRALETWYSMSRQIAQIQLKPCFPMDEAHRTALIAKGSPPHVFYHPCFSKHMAILRACAQKGWDPKTYLSTDHPFHLQLSRFLGELLSTEEGTIPWATDGCGLPTPVLTLAQMGTLYSALAQGKTQQLAFVRDRMVEFPQWVGGLGRFDTQLMGDNPKALLAKEGADGLFAVVDLREHVAFILKLAAGYYPKLIARVLEPLLEERGWKAHSEKSPHRFEFPYVKAHPDGFARPRVPGKTSS